MKQARSIVHVALLVLVVAGLGSGWLPATAESALPPAVAAFQEADPEAEGLNAWQWVAQNVFRIDLENPPDFLVFLGRFHPLILHLPIGLLLLAFLMEVFVRFRKADQLSEAVTFVLWLGSISAVAAALAGLLLSLGDSYDPVLLSRHMWLGLGVAVVSVVAYVLKKRAGEGAPKGLRWGYGVTLVGMVLLLTVTSHFGGSITHGSGYLTEYMPDPMRRVAGLPPKPEKIATQQITDLNAAVVYRDIIHPILDDRCITCHRPGKVKGGLRLDGPEHILRGGDEGPVIVAGNAEDSELFRRVVLPEDDEDHMPSERESLDDDRIELLRWWIDSGASFDASVAQVTITDDVEPVLNRLTGGDAASGPLALDIPPADTADVAIVRNLGVLVMPIAAEHSLLQVQTTNVTKTFGDEQLKALASIAPQITWLNLANTQVTDAGLAELAAMENLTRVHLEQTGITDAALVHLKDLPYLEYLNLYGTSVTDEGLSHLAGLASLKSLYLWQTGVTPEGVARLQEALPELYVNLGWEGPQTASTEEGEGKATDE